MADQAPKFQTLGKALLAIALTIGVPVTAISQIRALRTNLALSCVLLVSYEVVALVASFASSIFVNLRRRWTERAADSLDLWMQRKLSRFTRAYLRYTLASTRYLDLKGLTTLGEHALEMQDVLVSLALVPTPVRSLTPNPLRGYVGSGYAAPDEIWYWLKRSREENAVLAIVGPPGSGKTTLLRHVAFVTVGRRRSLSLRRVPHRLPVLINIREHHEWLLSSEDRSLARLLRRSLSNVDRPEPAGWIEHNLRAGNFLILLDGLDEVPVQEARAAIIQWVENQRDGQPGNQFVLTSRPFGYRERPVVGATVVETQPFTAAQISQFVDQWYRATMRRSHGADNDSSRLAAKQGTNDLLSRLEQMPSLFELASNPLLLTMVANVHHYRSKLPGSRAELYEEICEVLLSRRHQARGVVVELPGRQKRSALKALAYHMLCEEIVEIAADDAARVVRPMLSRMPRTVQPEDFLRIVEESSGLMLEKERKVYAFAHLTFQEYLAAEHIRDHHLASKLIDNLTSSWWRETVLLFCAISDATDVVDACLAASSSPELVALAARCVEEALEVAQSSRIAVETAVNPPDARDNVLARQAAAQARLQLRATRDIVLGRNRFIGEPITWLEYQYFLDVQEDGSSRVPDHWTDSVYPVGQDNEPVAGIRFDDAVDFCAWLAAEVGSGFRYRPPRAEEIEALLVHDTRSSQRAFWTTTPSSIQKDGRFWPLYRHPMASFRRDPYPMVAMPDGWIGASLETDLMTGISHVGVLELLAQAESGPSVCDVGTLISDISEAAVLVKQYLDTSPSLAATERHMLALEGFAAKLKSATEDALDRASWAHRQAIYMARLRKEARKAALGAAQECATLYELYTGITQLPPKEKTPRPTRWNPTPSRSPEVAMNVLARAFVEIYTELTVMDGRISGAIAPTEGLAYSRDLGQGDGDDRWGAIKAEAAKARRRNRWLALKPLVDRLVAAVALLLLAPFFLAIVLAVLVSDGRPVYFRQVRVGRFGEPFIMYKFRTMAVNAENLKQSLMDLNVNADAVLFKVRRDPRVTKLGAILRRYSFDEFPQLLNILRGDMALVGPRPPMPTEVSGYSDSLARRLLVRPGLTGLWQVSGRSDLPWAEAVRLDLLYIEQCSARLDASIMMRTFKAVVRGAGAY